MYNLKQHNIINSSIRILGVDPGSLITGFGVLEGNLQHLHVQVIQYGAIVLKKKANLVDRLGELHSSFQRIIENYQPDWIVVEKIFLSHNPQTAFVLGHARGVILALAGVKNIPIAEYLPRVIKKSLTGSGQAEKTQVAECLRYHLGLKSVQFLDSSDALALAWHHLMILLEKKKLTQSLLKYDRSSSR